MGRIQKCKGFYLAASLGAMLIMGGMTAAAADGTVSKGVSIEGVDVSGMTKAQVKDVIRDLTAKNAQTSLTVTVGENSSACTLADLGLTCTNTDIIDQIMNLGARGNIVQRYKDQKDLEESHVDFTLTYAVDSKAAQSWADNLSQFNTEPENASIYTTDELLPGVSGGTTGLSVDIAQTAEAIVSAANAWDKTSPLSVEAVVETTQPDVTYEEMAAISDVLGTATTDYSASSYARAANVENGCSKITGTLLYPGDSFSVTDALVPFTAENGYQQAPSYEENRVVDSYGGGICQVSTTLYNAVLKAELEVTERSNHTMVVSYVPLSKDAAIAEGVMDMRFYNNLENPVYIIGYCWGGQISFTIYGKEYRSSSRSIEFESVTTSTVEPTSAKLYPNASQAVGYINQTQSPHTGYTAELWKHVYEDGVLVDSIQVNSSYYTAVGTIYDVGVMTDNAALSNAMYTAISSGDLSQVQSVIASASTYTTQTEAAPETQAQSGDVTLSIQAAEDAAEAAAVAGDAITIGTLE